MWIVRLALRRPYTFVVMAVLIALLGVVAIVSMPTDIFPYIDIPVVSVIWTYTGISPEEMAERIITVSERAMTTTVNDIEHMESQSLQRRRGDQGLSSSPTRRSNWRSRRSRRIVADDPARRCRRASSRPPSCSYNASSVPILQLEHERARRLSEQAALRLRLELHPHAAGDRAGRLCSAALRRQAAPDHGGSRSRRAVRQASLGHRRLERDQHQNLILPAGTAKMGDREYLVRLNSSPTIGGGVERPADQAA